MLVENFSWHIDFASFTTNERIIFLEENQEKLKASGSWRVCCLEMIERSKNRGGHFV
jgi:hypothetical protein